MLRFLCYYYFITRIKDAKEYSCTATSKTWIRTLDPDPEKPAPWKNLDPEKHESWKTWNKYGIKNISLESYVR